VGVATSYLYPSFSLAGFFGLQSDSLSDLFDSSALAWGIQSPVQWDVFNGGRIRQNVELQNARLRQRLLQYRLKVLKAIEEVENAIAAYNLNQQSEQHLVNASDAIDEAVQLVLVQYDTGITEFNNVLTTQRIQLSQQDQLIVTQTQAGLALIDLYRALGGGWNPDDAIPASVSP
jgi:outer membrane protein TolC